MTIKECAMNDLMLEKTINKNCLVECEFDTCELFLVLSENCFILRDDYNAGEIRSYSSDGEMMYNKVMDDICSMRMTSIESYNEIIIAYYNMNNYHMVKFKNIQVYHNDNKEYYIVLELHDDSVQIITLYKTHLKVALCENRHDIQSANDGAIFPSTLNPLDTNGIHKMAYNKLKHVKSLQLYVTGLTVALVEVINVCVELGIRLSLYHYDKTTDRYFRQSVNI